MIIEKLKVEDISELIELYQELVTYDYSLDKTKSTYKKMLEDSNYLVLVAKEKGKIIGSALAVCCSMLTYNGSNFLVIEDVIVKDNLRGSGVGKKLFEAIDDFALENNCLYSLIVSSANRLDAHKFYEKVGYNDPAEGFRKLY